MGCAWGEEEMLAPTLGVVSTDCWNVWQIKEVKCWAIMFIWWTSCRHLLIVMKCATMWTHEIAMFGCMAPSMDSYHIFQSHYTLCVLYLCPVSTPDPLSTCDVCTTCTHVHIQFLMSMVRLSTAHLVFNPKYNILLVVKDGTMGGL